MIERPNILVVCGRNKKRSRTAEHIFKNDDRFSIRSVGLSPQSNRKISESDLKWASMVFVMEYNHKGKLKELYKNIELPKVEVLDIADEYEFMDEDLVEMLTERMNEKMKFILGV